VARLGEGIVLAELVTDAGNGKLFAFLSQCAEVTDRTYAPDNRVKLTCRLDRRYLGKLRNECELVTLRDAFGRAIGGGSDNGEE